VKVALGVVLMLSLALPPPAVAEESDPLEPLNRKIFWFNEQLDRLLLEPAARGWDFIWPSFMRTGFTNFFTNLRFPVRLVGNLGQAKARNSVDETARFIVNTTVGLAGFFDPATHRAHLELHDEDFGQALGYWGVGAGPYLVLPVFGPSNPRDALGLAVDTALLAGPGYVSSEVGVALAVTNIVNLRADALEDIREAKEASLDYYVFLRNAFAQRRRERIADGRGASKAEEEDLYDDDLYEFDEE
jgi:phospholipid-binding lipoprotein MlaA